VAVALGLAEIVSSDESELKRLDPNGEVIEC
jgi:hypothetical protein